MKLKSIALATLLAMGVNVQAADFSYSNLELGIGQVEADSEDGSIDGDMLALAASFELGETFYFNVGLGKVDYDGDISSDSQHLGIGAHTALGENTDLFGEVSFLRGEVDFYGYSDDDTGNAIALGLRHMATSNLEVYGGVERVDIFEETENSLFVGVSYALTESLELGASYSDSDDASAYGVGLRINF